MTLPFAETFKRSNKKVMDAVLCYIRPHTVPTSGQTVQMTSTIFMLIVDSFRVMPDEKRKLCMSRISVLF